MSVAQLVHHWLSHPRWEMQHLARNLLLDCQGVPGAHPDSQGWGNRLDQKVVSQLDTFMTPILQQFTNPDPDPAQPHADWRNHLREGLKRKLEHQLNQAGGTIASIVPFPDSDETIQLVRYVSYRVVDDYWLDNPPDAQMDPKSVCARVEATINAYKRQRKSKSKVADIIKGDAALAQLYHLAWAAPGENPPHLDPSLEKATESERALHVVRSLALPDFEEPGQLQDELGVVAALYSVKKSDLRTPTVVDGGCGWLFFPGPMNDPCGRAASLDQNFQSPWKRTPDNSKLGEWLHINESELTSIMPTLKIVGRFA
ncbi:MAG: hypothetical protein HQL52_19690 [Magnetococcales bacterium]|nr:hypothetical protein [Magnetococcales bacterium]